MGLTYEQARSLGLAHLWPESKPAPAAPPAESRAPRDGMNKLERGFWERLRDAGGGPAYREGLTFRLAGRTRYTPDFVSVGMTAHRVTCWEIKGFMRDDAAVKLKVAAELFPWVIFVLVTREKRVWACRFVTARGIERDVWVPDWLA